MAQEFASKVAWLYKARGLEAASPAGGEARSGAHFQALFPAVGAEDGGALLCMGHLCALPEVTKGVRAELGGTQVARS